ncbi:hypothetical protein BDE40_2669 [Litoreibacter halocynthiae]|uniref:Uncharacterized protein n=1 Tax=Litoreibacter halocynthiae TaxID=1242689 RepID=A0A4R7LHR6_9RHOB|nr:hypothetical protein [Litoreibacter halocynthiae]TDT73891.1 hypothetical protein BDE40_2669 [Litoreibacter halocynthiae]
MLPPELEELVTIFRSELRQRLLDSRIGGRRLNRMVGVQIASLRLELAELQESSIELYRTVYVIISRYRAKSVSQIQSEYSAQFGRPVIDFSNPFTRVAEGIGAYFDGVWLGILDVPNHIRNNFSSVWNLHAASAGAALLRPDTAAYFWAGVGRSVLEAQVLVMIYRIGSSVEEIIDQARNIYNGNNMQGRLRRMGRGISSRKIQQLVRLLNMQDTHDRAFEMGKFLGPLLIEIAISIATGGASAALSAGRRALAAPVEFATGIARRSGRRVISDTASQPNRQLLLDNTTPVLPRISDQAVRGQNLPDNHNLAGPASDVPESARHANFSNANSNGRHIEGNRGLEPAISDSDRVGGMQITPEITTVPLSSSALRSVFSSARRAFNRLRPQFQRALGIARGRGGQVHHAIELQVITRYPNVFPVDELNHISNMRGIPPERLSFDSTTMHNRRGRRALHNSAIREFWDNQYRLLDQTIEIRHLDPNDTFRKFGPDYNDLVRRRIYEAVREHDWRFGAFFSESRRQRDWTPNFETNDLRTLDSNIELDLPPTLR